MTELRLLWESTGRALLTKLDRWALKRWQNVTDKILVNIFDGLSVDWYVDVGWAYHRQPDFLIDLNEMENPVEFRRELRLHLFGWAVGVFFGWWTVIFLGQHISSQAIAHLALSHHHFLLCLVHFSSRLNLPLIFPWFFAFYDFTLHYWWLNKANKQGYYVYDNLLSECKQKYTRDWLLLNL